MPEGGERRVVPYIIPIVTFDTLQPARKLETTGFAWKQVADMGEALVEAMANTKRLTRGPLDSRLRESEQWDAARLEQVLDFSGGRGWD